MKQIEAQVSHDELNNSYLCAACVANTELCDLGLNLR